MNGNVPKVQCSVEAAAKSSPVSGWGVVRGGGGEAGTRQGRKGRGKGEERGEAGRGREERVKRREDRNQLLPI